MQRNLAIGGSGQLEGGQGVFDPSPVQYTYTAITSEPLQIATRDSECENFSRKLTPRLRRFSHQVGIL